MSDRRIHRVTIGKVRIKPDWKPEITHHAVLRFLERVRGIDIEAVRDEIRTETLKQAIVFGAGHVKRDDCVLVIESGKVITVLDKGMRPKDRNRHASKRAQRLMQEFAE